MTTEPRPSPTHPVVAADHTGSVPPLESQALVGVRGVPRHGVRTGNGAGRGGLKRASAFARLLSASPIAQSAAPSLSLHVCRNIKTLYNFDPPATEAEIQGAALQFVRKVSGFTKPSKVNEPAFDRAVDGVASAVRILLISLATSAVPHNREIEAARARERALRRFTSGNASSAVPP